MTTSLERARAHFLLAGDSADLERLQDACSRLPADAYGQVFVEVASLIQVRRLHAPDGMSVVWLSRDRGARGLVRRGELLARAVEAWVGEWMPGGAGHEQPYVLWVGCAASERVDRLVQELAARFGLAHVHGPHGR